MIVEARQSFQISGKFSYRILHNLISINKL